jgi:excisionase family DNA binding protein
MTTTSRTPSADEAMERLMTQTTISVYDAMRVLKAGEPTVRAAIRSGTLPSITLGGRNVRIPSAHLRRMLGIDADATVTG